MDLNEKLAQRRKEREQNYIADKSRYISNKRLEAPINVNLVLSVFSLLVFVLIFSLYYVGNNKIKGDIKNAFDNYGVFWGVEYGSVSISANNSACMVFCVKKNCQIAKFLKIENDVWVVKDIDSTSSVC